MIKDLLDDFVGKAFEEVTTGGIEVLNTLRIWQDLYERIVKPVFVLALKQLGSVAFVLGKFLVLVELWTDKPVKARKTVVRIGHVGS
jgi:hypothetical protein